MTAAKCSPNPYDSGRAQWGVSSQPVTLGNYAEPMAPSGIVTGMTDVRG